MTERSRAPVALFAYNRPAHTRRTLESLAANPLASETVLHIYADGSKGAADAAGVAAVRALLRERLWCGEVHVYAAPANRGLAPSILMGVTERLEQSPRLIVLEDDLELAPGFLTYMNDALTAYESEPKVMQVAGFLPELNMPLPETFFLRTASSWGWGTWRRAWAGLRTDAAEMLREVEQAGRLHEFDLDGGYPFAEQLRLNATGRIQTWAILWYASIFLADGLVLHPGRSLVRNIGHDGSGTNSRPDARFELEALKAREVKVERLPLFPHAEARAAMRQRYGAMGPAKAAWKSALARARSLVFGLVSRPRAR